MQTQIEDVKAWRPQDTSLGCPAVDLCLVQCFVWLELGALAGRRMGTLPDAHTLWQSEGGKPSRGVFASRGSSGTEKDLFKITYGTGSHLQVTK